MASETHELDGRFQFSRKRRPDESRFAAHITLPIIGRATLQTVTLDPPMPASQREEPVAASGVLAVSSLKLTFTSADCGGPSVSNARSSCP
jgi:hypothetical protein